MWNLPEISQGLDMCTYTFWQHIPIILYESLPCDKELSDEQLSSIFGAALVKPRAAKIHCQLPASGSFSMCSPCSSRGDPTRHHETPLPLPNTELRSDFFSAFLFLFCTTTKKPHQTPKNKPLPEHQLTLLELFSMYLNSGQET